MRTRGNWTGIASAALLACGGGGGSAGGDGPAVAFETAFGGIAFDRAVKLVQHPTDDGRWYVVEQDGHIRTFLASDPAGTLEEVLDLEEDGILLGATSGTGEQGLLGLAFDTDFATTRELYIAYTDELLDQSILARYVSGDGVGDFAEDAIVIAIDHVADNHNGGDLEFGPDGYLYYSMGDGAENPDAFDQTQRTDRLLGSVMRIDVNASGPDGEEYAIPDDNPFENDFLCEETGVQAEPGEDCPEIFAWGFRNPWRMHFDPEDDVLWLGDVGLSTREEIDEVVRGGNYGWSCVEGDVTRTGASSSPDCDLPGFEPPHAVHPRSEAAAISGGVVYRGAEFPELQGFYIYGDYVQENFFAFDADDPMSEPARLDLPGRKVAAFGQARSGEIYAVVHGDPSILEIVAEAPAP